MSAIVGVDDIFTGAYPPAQPTQTLCSNSYMKSIRKPWNYLYNHMITVGSSEMHRRLP